MRSINTTPEPSELNFDAKAPVIGPIKRVCSNFIKGSEEKEARF
jgi:hypothetical protein